MDFEKRLDWEEGIVLPTLPHPEPQIPDPVVPTLREREVTWI